MDDETDDETPDAPPWFAPGHADSLRARACRPRPRERLWTLVKGGKRVDAELLFHGEYGVEVQFLHEGILAYGQRFVLRADALEEAETNRRRLLAEGWAGRPRSSATPAEDAST